MSRQKVAKIFSLVISSPNTPLSEIFFDNTQKKVMYFFNSFVEISDLKSQKKESCKNPK